MVPPEPMLLATVAMFAFSTVIMTFVAVKIFYLALPLISSLRAPTGGLEPAALGGGFGPLQAGAWSGNQEVSGLQMWKEDAEGDLLCLE